MRKFLLGLSVLAIVAAACAPEDETPAEPAEGSASEAPVDAASCAARPARVSDGMLTIGTGNPAYPAVVGGQEHR